MIARLINRLIRIFRKPRYPAAVTPELLNELRANSEFLRKWIGRP